jgi:predicted O-methyltransferase YrrM
MKYADIHALVGGVPFISKRNAEFLYHFIIEHRLTRILELGIAHGTATCYMAAALDELGGGSITAVDLLAARDHYRPSAEEQLEKTNLARYVTIHRMQTGYTWFLHDEIARNTVNDVCQEIYDLCIIDGPKNWTIDGAAFFFADKLLKRGGWMIFDDYHWTYAKADDRRDATDGITHRTLSQAERETPHIREVFELLVKQHPNYGNFLLLESTDWALAQKSASPIKTYEIRYLTRRSLLDRLRGRPRVRR